jgi:hypothetical protein
VRMRSRKPWVLCRRRLFGWYVRLLNVFTPLEGWVQQSGHTGSRRARLVASCGQLAPLAHEKDRLDRTVMDMRHRSTPVQTCQRYVSREDRVNSTSSGPARHAHRVSRRDTPQPGDNWSCPCGQLVDPQVRELLGSVLPGSPTARFAHRDREFCGFTLSSTDRSHPGSLLRDWSEGLGRRQRHGSN